jgi:hypothetical protein
VSALGSVVDVKDGSTGLEFEGEDGVDEDVGIVFFMVVVVVVVAMPGT